MASSSRGGLELTVKILYDRVEQDMVDYSVAMGRDLSLVVRQQMRLLVIGLMKLTPPFNSRAARNESWAAQRRTGEQAVIRDVNRVFIPLDTLASKFTQLGPAMLTALDENNIIAIGNGTSLPELLTDGKVIRSPDDFKLMDAPSDAVHNRQRDNRGRVRRRFSDIYFVRKASDLKRYISSETQKVGITKGGWGAAATRFGVSVPHWISRNFSGEVVDRSGDSENPHAIAINEVPWIENQDADLRIADYALQDRAKAMERQIAVVLEKRKL